MNYWPYASIVETHPGNHVLQTFLSYNLSFHSLSPVTSLITPTNDGPVLMDSAFAGPAEAISKLRLTSDVPKLLPSQSTLLCTSPYSSAVIDIDNYLDIYHLTPCHLNPAASTNKLS